jgi:hypothetical protein
MFQFEIGAIEDWGFLVFCLSLMITSFRAFSLGIMVLH